MKRVKTRAGDRLNSPVVRVLLEYKCILSSSQGTAGADWMKYVESKNKHIYIYKAVKKAKVYAIAHVLSSPVLSFSTPRATLACMWIMVGFCTVRMCGRASWPQVDLT
jgi:hypothetical protein